MDVVKNMIGDKAEIIFDAKLKKWLIIDSQGNQRGNVYITKKDALKDLKLIGLKYKR
jgi:hypothetical protein